MSGPLARPAAAVVAAVALVAVLAGAGGLAAASAIGKDAASAGGNDAGLHPTPPAGEPTATAPERTPTGNGSPMRMRVERAGVVTNGDPPRLPPGCDALAGTKRVTLRAGARFAEAGETFAFSRDRIQAPPCTRLVVRFVNEDEVRHQFMVHGLPRSVYPMGMFTIEVDGPGRLTGSFVTPATNYTLHTHCSLPQHAQKGMQMRVVVGDGGAGLVGGPGHSHGAVPHTHTAGGHSPDGVAGPGFGPVAAVVALALVLLGRWRGFARWRG